MRVQLRRVAASARHPVAIAAASLLLATGCSRPALRVCADPNNLPYSNRAGEGFENEIAELLARDRHATIEYTWWAQRRGSVRNTLNAGACDVLIGVPTTFGLAETTKPYYRSTYVFASKRERHLGLGSLDDPRLRRFRIGVQMIGDDFRNTPPAHALSNRGIVRNVVGYTVYGDYAKPSPLSNIVDAVERGEIDAAVVWGPVAGYFTRTDAKDVELNPVSPQADSPAVPFVFDISMGVRRGEDTLRDELNDFITRRGVEINAILDRYGVPRVND